MPITNYPFTLVGGKPRPVLPVILENPGNGRTYLTWALIDTGADSIVVPGFIAGNLAHDNNAPGVHSESCSGVGGNADTYYHTFRMRILSLDKQGEMTDKVAVSIKKRVFAVAPGLPIMLLGVDHFLAKYVLSVNYPKRIFSVKSDQ